MSDILKNSLAQNGGIKKGDILLKINDRTLRDIIDYQIIAEEPQLKLSIKRGKKTKTINILKDEGEPVGIRFDSSIFNTLRHCQNKCIFCFLDQMPRGLRKSLYIKDDDFRLSFLYGNFITLTNLDDKDIRRIIDQRLSPLYVSLHSTDTKIRKTMLQPKNDMALKHLKALVGAGIEINIQIVLCPGINDGPNLRDTLEVLDADFSDARSIGIVPVGLTKYRDSLYPLRNFTANECEQLIQQISPMQEKYVKEMNGSWIFLSDEFYISAGVALPSVDHYEDFPQLENGIGIAAKFSHEIEENLRSFKVCRTLEEQYTILTGVLAAPLLKKEFGKIQKKIGGNFNVIGLPNDYFGTTVSVAGLITGKDIIKNFKKEKPEGTLLIPDVMLNSDNLFIDDLSIQDIENELNVSVRIMPVEGKALLEKILDLGER